MHSSSRHHHLSNQHVVSVLQVRQVFLRPRHPGAEDCQWRGGDSSRVPLDHLHDGRQRLLVLRGHHTQRGVSNTGGAICYMRMTISDGLWQPLIVFMATLIKKTKMSGWVLRERRQQCWSILCCRSGWAIMITRIRMTRITTKNRHSRLKCDIMDRIDGN